MSNKITDTMLSTKEAKANISNKHGQAFLKHEALEAMTILSGSFFQSLTTQ